VFTIKLDLPSGKTVRIEELNNRNYLTIIKFCQNGDHEGLNNFFNDIYFNSDLNIFDRFYILLCVRSMFIDKVISYSGKGDAEIKYSISDITSKLVDNYKEVEKVLEYKDFKIKVNIPTELYFENIDDLYRSTIVYVQYKEKKVYFSELTDDERNFILDKLPTQVFLLLQDYMNYLSDTLFDLTLIEENKDFEISEVKVNILGNGVLFFLASIFNFDLFSFFETYYYYTHFVSKGASDFYDMSFNEVRVLLNIHAERIEKENREIKKQERLLT